MDEELKRQAMALGRALTRFPGIQSTLSKRNNAEQEYAKFWRKHGQRLRAKYKGM